MKKMAGILRERIGQLETEENKKSEQGIENDRKGLFAQKEEV